MQKARKVLIAAVFVAALSLAGCTTGAPAEGPSTGSSDEQLAQAQAIVDAATSGLVSAEGLADIDPAAIQPFDEANIPAPESLPGETHTIGLISCVPAGGCLSVANVMKAVFERAGWTVLTGAGDTTPAKFQTLVDSYIAQDVDAIALVAVPGAFIQAQLAAAEQAGIVTIAVNTSPADGEGYTGYLYAQENLQKSILSASMAVKSEGTANAKFFGLVGGDSLGVTPAVTFLGKVCSGCTTSTETWNPPDYVNPVTVQSKAQSLVVANPDTDYFVWPTSGLPLQPVIAAIAQAGRSDTLKLVSSDLDATSLALVQAGDFEEATVIPYSWVGFAAVDAVLKGLAGTDMPDAGSWGFGYGLVNADNAPTGDPSAETIDAYVTGQFDYAAFYGDAWGFDVSDIHG